jgi:hypothetical protein
VQHPTAEQTIQIAVDRLPPVNQFSVEVGADPIRTWEALIATIPRMFDTRRSRRGASLLGAAHTEARGDPSVIGSTLPGFVVSRSVRPALLALLGQHRYSRYALVFSIDDLGGGRSRINAETRAEYPGRAGSVFGALLTRSRGQLTAVNKILEAVRKRAEGAVATLTRAQLSKWLADYERAWRTEGTDALGELFSSEASYSTTPYAKPHLGLDAIKEMWEEERLTHEEIFTMVSEIVAVEADTGVARIAVHYEGPSQQEYRDLWIIRLDEAGRCVHFEEWPFWPEGTHGHPSEGAAPETL